MGTYNREPDKVADAAQTWKNEHDLSPCARLGLSSVTALLAGSSLFLAALLSPAVSQATGLGVQTSFEIDGNIEAKGTPSVSGPELGDWVGGTTGTTEPGDDPQPVLPDGSGFYLTPGPTPQGFPSTAIVDSTFLVDANTPYDPADATTVPCSGTDPTGFDNQTTSMNSEWIVVSGVNVQTNDDVCMAGAALEIVDVNVDPDPNNPNPNYSQLHYIYSGFIARKPNATGDSSIYFILEGPESQSLACTTNNIPDRVDDILVQFDFDASGGTTVTTYRWEVITGPNRCQWVQFATFAPNPDIFQFTPGRNNFIGPTGYAQPLPPTTLNGGQASATVNDNTLYEYAIDLTAAGIIPQDRCVRFESNQFVTNSGNSLTSRPKDSIEFPDPIVIDNCNGLIVQKETNVPLDQQFLYIIGQLDEEPVHTVPTTPSPPGPQLTIDGTVTTPGSLGGNLIQQSIKAGELHEWSYLISEPDYELLEAAPAPWGLERIECTYYDRFGTGDGEPAGVGEKTVTLYGPLTQGAVFPGGYGPLDDNGDGKENAFAIPPSAPLPAGLTAADLVPECTIRNLFTQVDFGDAPDSYGTSAAADGARHVIAPELRIGPNTVDADSNNLGIPDTVPPVTGFGPGQYDDETDTDDEDGVTFQSFAGGGFPIQATVTGTVGGARSYLCAYLDGAADGLIDGQFTRNVSYTDSVLGAEIDLTGNAGAGNEEICVSIISTGGSAITNTSTAMSNSTGFNGASANCTKPTPDSSAFTCTIVFNPNFTAAGTTYARFRLTSDPTFSPLSNATPSPIGPAIDGEVEDYVVLFNPTAVTIGSVDLQALAVTDFLDGIDIDGMTDAELLDLLAAWDPEAADALAGADREAILAALRRYLDPDGDGQVAVLRWDTLEQRGTVGFYVDRRTDDGAWQRINGDMLPAIIAAPLGGEYRLADPAARAGERYEYQLIEQEATGTTRTYGPFSLEVSP